MKRFNKAVAIALFSTLLSHPAYSQAGYKFGIRKSINLSRLAPGESPAELREEVIGTPVTAGNTHGMAFHFGLSNSVSIETGVELAILKYKMSLRQDGTTFENRSVSYSWSFPFLVAHRGIIREISPRNGIWLKKSVGFHALVLHPHQLAEVSTGDHWTGKYITEVNTKFDFTFDAGGAVEIDLGNGWQVISIGASYHKGFRDVLTGTTEYKNGSRLIKSTGTGRNSHFSIDLIWYLPC